MVFQVPQFIETEDKIVGPLTLKQFIYVAGAFGICFGLFFIFQITLWLLLTMIVAAIAAALAFLKVGGLDLVKIILAALKFYWNPRRYFWQHKVAVPQLEKEEKIEKKKFELPKFKIPKIAVLTKKPKIKEVKLTTGANLKNLSEKLMTTKNNIPQREKPLTLFKTKSKERYEILRKITGERIAAKRVDYR